MNARLAAIGICIAALFGTALIIASWPATTGPYYLDSEGYFRAVSYFADRSLTLQKIWDITFENPYPASKRVLPNVTFLVENWMFGLSPKSGRIINLAIHSINMVIVFLVCRRLLTVNRRTATLAAAGGFLASLLWAANPFHTETVFYVIQRMALLSTTFYLLAILAYLKAFSVSGRLRLLWLGVVGLCFVLSLSSKENAALLPLGLGLITWLFPGILSKSRKPVPAVRVYVALAICLVLPVLVVTLLGTNVPDLVSPSSTVESRGFTPLERMLTEGRVLIKYLTLLGFPSPHRISFVLKFETSRDLVTPVSTLLTWLLIVAACVGAVALRKKMPVVALALLWFFLHHCLESSFIPLEIAFMHRNYLPSVFLFLPLAVWIVNQVPSKPSRTSIAVASSIFLLLMVGWYSRATIWGSPVSFWSDGMAKAPGSLRPYINLGVIRDRQGQHSEAMEIFDRGAINGFDEPASAWASLYCCKGIAATNLGRYEEASAAMDLSMSFMELRDCLLHKANLLLFQSRPKDALIVLDRLGEIAPTHPRLHLLRGKAFLGLGRYDHARDAFRRELSLFPANQRAAELLLELPETD